MMRTLLLSLVLSLIAAFATESLASESPCVATAPQRMRVRFAGEAPRDVQIESTLPSGFRLLDAVTHEEIWSAGAEPGHTQQFSAMDSAFGASFAAVQLDADGVHDRLYAGDRAGRIWRFDLHTGARPAAWMEAVVLADLRAPGGGRGFVAAPDVARIETPNGESWLNVAIGTANTAAPRNDHRFYVLRDSLDRRAAAPLQEADLESLVPPAGATRGNSRGYYLSLGSAQVLAQALTVEGRIYFTVAETSRNLLAACNPGTLPAVAAPLSVTVLRARDGDLEIAEQHEIGSGLSSLRRHVSDAMPATTGVELATSRAGADGVVPCMIGDESLPQCFVDTRPKRSWWRREDAD